MLSNQSFEAGLFGLDASTYPGRDRHAEKDHYYDLGIDSEYQFSFGRHDFLASGSFIYGRENWKASRQMANVSNSRDHLFSTNVAVDYLYDKTIGGDVSYFRSDGTRDPLLYGDGVNGSPLSDGVILEVNYLPFNKRGGPAF